MPRMSLEEALGFDIETVGQFRDYTMLNGQGISVSKRGKASATIAFAPPEKGSQELFKAMKFAKLNNLPAILQADKSLKNSGTLHPEILKYKEFIAYGYETSLTHELPGMVQLVLETRKNVSLSTVLSGFVQEISYLMKNAQRNKSPHYVINTSHLVGSIEDFTKQKIACPREMIPVYRSRYTDVNNLSLFDEQPFERAIVQKNGSMFTYDAELEGLVKNITADTTNDREKSKKIFDWIIENISYNEERLNDINTKTKYTYAGALLTYKLRSGVCGERAALQVTMERLAGNISYYAKVGTIGIKKEWEAGGPHAIAMHLCPDGQLLQVDPTRRNGFGMNYKSISILSDEEASVRNVTF